MHLNNKHAINWLGKLHSDCDVFQISYLTCFANSHETVEQFAKAAANYV